MASPNPLPETIHLSAAPAVSFDPLDLPTTGTAPLAPSPGDFISPGVCVLKGVRLRPMTDGLRVLFLLDRPAPYTVRMEPGSQRAYLDLIRAHVGYVPPELGRLDHPSLSGIWLKRMDAGLATLELRLAKSGIRIEHFALEDPPVIVLDLLQTQSITQRVVAYSEKEVAFQAPESTPVSTNDPEATPSADLLINPSGSVLPNQWLQPAATPATEVELPQDVKTADPTPITEFHAEPIEEAPVHHAVDTRPVELEPVSAEFDHFPVHAVEVGSPLGESVLNAFLYRRWGEVLTNGVEYLKKNRINQETYPVLYLIAEARWQVSAVTADAPLVDLMNFYTQALRTYDAGELGAFGHWRTAGMLSRMGDHDAALEHLNRALATPDPALQWMVLALKARTMSEMGQNEQALKLTPVLASKATTTDDKVKAHLLAGAIQLKMGNYEASWKDYQVANELDPEWMQLDQGMENFGSMIKAAMEAGDLDAAFRYSQYLKAFLNQSNVEGDEFYRFGVLFADILDRMGDSETASDTYRLFLKEFEKNPTGAAVQQTVFRDHKQIQVESEQRYCMLLWRQGKVREAMAELARAYDQCIREEIDLEPLLPLVETILPTFMREAIANRQYFDSARAWQYYGHKIPSDGTRLECLALLVEAFEGLGLDEDALKLVTLLIKEGPSPNLPPMEQLRITEADLYIKTNRAASAIPDLEKLVDSVNDPDLKIRTYRSLARAYLENDQTLEAAQALQTLAAMPNVDAPLLGESLLQAGSIFLDRGMAQQATEVGLKCLILEKQRLEQGLDSGWSATTGNSIRLMLARSYIGRRDFVRSAIMLDDLLDRPNLAPENRAMAQTMLGESLRRSGRLTEASKVYASAIKPDVPQLLQDNARRELKILEWDRDHPQWRVGPEALQTN